jgi:hypothetical protein
MVCAGRGAADDEMRQSDGVGDGQQQQQRASERRYYYV